MSKLNSKLALYTDEVHWKSVWVYVRTELYHKLNTNFKCNKRNYGFFRQETRLLGFRWNFELQFFLGCSSNKRTTMTFEGDCITNEYWLKLFYCAVLRKKMNETLVCTEIHYLTDEIFSLDLLFCNGIDYLGTMTLRCIASPYIYIYPDESFRKIYI